MTAAPTHLLDTNACIDSLRHGPASRVAARLLTAPTRSVALCSVVVAELEYGAHRSAKPADTLAKVRTFCTGHPSLPFDDAAAAEYGVLKAHLAAGGTMIGPNDLLIAAIALAAKVTLVTRNLAEFARVPGLVVEDWQ